MPGRLAIYRLPVIAALAVVACLYAFSPNFRYASGPAAGPYAGDFLQEWLGAWIVRCGDLGSFYDAEYAYSLQHNPRLVGFEWNADEYLPLVYPPFYYLLISPLSRMSLHAAAWVWAGLMASALAAALCLLASLFPRTYSKLSTFSRRSQIAFSTLSTFSRRSQIDASAASGRRLNESGKSRWRNERSPLDALLPWLIPAAVLFVPVLESLGSSQKGTLCLLILTGSFLLWDRRRPLAAGMVFGLLAFKPQLALVIAAAAIWKRQWRFAAGGAMTAAMLAGLSLLAGADVCRQYVRFAWGAGEYMQTAGYDLHKSHSVWGFARLLWDGQGGIEAAALAVALAALVICQLAAVLNGRLVPGSGRFRWQLASLAVATVLLSPHVFTYDLTILLLPMALVIAQHTSLTRKRSGAADSETRATAGSSRSLMISAAARAANASPPALLGLTALVYLAPPISTSLAAAIGLQVTVPLMIVYLAALSRGAAGVSRTARPVRIDAGARGQLTPTA